MKTILAAALSCLIGAAGFGSALALAGGGHKAWGCKPSWSAKKCKHHKPPTETITLTITTPGTTVTETTPTTTPTTVPETTPSTVTVTTPPETVTTPPVTVTVPVTTPVPVVSTVTVTTPAPPQETVTVTKIKRVPAKTKKKKPAKTGVAGRQTKPPPKHKGAGVTG